MSIRPQIVRFDECIDNMISASYASRSSGWKRSSQGSSSYWKWSDKAQKLRVGLPVEYVKAAYDWVDVATSGMSSFRRTSKIEDENIYDECF